MLFNSYVFIFVFLPISTILYFLLNKLKLTIASRIWLVIASLIFYGWWKKEYVLLIIISILVNYAFGNILTRLSDSQKIFYGKQVLFFGICFNLLLLCYYKYTNFFISNINHIINTNIPLFDIILPLGISFFTFTQTAYLVDSYKGGVKEYSLLNYFLFVTFFPHILAGPIIHHKEMMPQFSRLRNKILNNKNLASGIYLFSIGLAKKVLIADTFAILANQGFNNAENLGFFDSWAISLSYTFQLYFDFSGYTDMALGSALMFNIKLPANFNSPYKALSIQDFWRRWHITLSRFLRDYVYIPLGGNRVILPINLLNLFVTFLIGGIWHGAGWTFVAWGALHGVAMVINRLWSAYNLKMPKILAWFLSFNFVNIAWVFFRANSFDSAFSILKTMLGFNGIPFLTSAPFGTPIPRRFFILLPLFMTICIALKNSNQMLENYKPSWKIAVFTGIIFAISIMSLTKVSEFIYFNF